MSEEKIIPDEWIVSSFEIEGDKAILYLKKKNRKEYHVGDTFIYLHPNIKKPSYYMIVTPQFKKVSLINLKDGNRWDNEISINHPWKITEKEFKNLVGKRNIQYFIQINLSIIPVTELYEILLNLKQLYSINSFTIHEYHRKIDDVYDKILDWIKEGEKWNIDNIDYSKINFKKLFEDVEYKGKEK